MSDAVKFIADEVQRRRVADLIPYARNARTHSPTQVAQIAGSMREFGFTYPILIDDEDGIIAGHGRIMAAERLKLEEVPVIVARGWTEAQKRAYILADNKIALNSSWDEGLLKIELADLQGQGFDLGLTGFTAIELGDFGIQGFAPSTTPEAAPPKVKLADSFGIAPFSVLNAREGWWQGRKRAWLSLGIASEVGRGDNLLKMSETILEPDAEKRAAKKANGKGPARAFAQDLMKGEHVVGSTQTPSLKGGLTHGISIGAYQHEGEAIESASGAGTSIFDPVLCELAYRWFCPPGGSVIDPFAGGSVRGIVAGKLKRKYTGIDLRPEQIEANRAQAKDILRRGEPSPTWVEGDSKNLPQLVKAGGFDFLFSCPPYLWLEVYSDDPRDLSTMTEGAFEEVYREIIARAAEKLGNDRFACFVVGDVRDKKGNYVDFPGMTIRAFEAAGLALYNDAILVTAAGSLPMRVRRQFQAGRKLGTTHQRVLVFLKGDAKKATQAIGDVEFGEIEEGDDSAFGEAL